MNISRWVAEKMAGLAHDLATRLPLTCKALREGSIDAYKAQVIAEATRCLDDVAAAAAEATIIDALAGKTPGQIRALIARAVLKADPGAARKRREQAQQDARVELWREDAGTAAIVSFGLPPDEALAADQQITTRAMELKAAGVPGSTDRLRVRAYLDALLGQDTTTRYTSGAHPAGDGTPPGQSGRPGDGTPPGEPGQPGDATPPGQSGRPSDSRSPGEPGHPGHPGHAGEPGEAVGPGQPGDGTPRGEPGQPGTSGEPDGPGHPARHSHPAARINLTVPLATLLGLAEHPGEASGFGPIDPALARVLAAQAAGHPATSWCVTVTDSAGHPVSHGCGRPGRRRRKTARSTGPARPDTQPPHESTARYRTGRARQHHRPTRSANLQHQRTAGRLRDLAAPASQS